MAEAKHSKKRPPEAGPKEAASRIDRFLRDAPALFEHAGVQPWPTYSLPAGLSRDGLPIGMQLIGPVFSEETLLRAARMYEKASGVSRLTPAMGGPA